jgi:hypothetical protein
VWQQKNLSKEGAEEIIKAFKETFLLETGDCPLEHIAFTPLPIEVKCF